MSKLFPRTEYKHLSVVSRLVSCGLVLSSLVVSLSGQERQPVFVGSKVCTECHQGKGMGYQRCKWLLSGHATAYALLATPEAQRIARLSGEPQPPQVAALCLGCHATGAHMPRIGRKIQPFELKMAYNARGAMGRAANTVP